MVKRRRRPGRPRTGKNAMIAIRWPRPMLDAIDRYVQDQMLPRPPTNTLSTFRPRAGRARITISPYPAYVIRQRPRTRNMTYRDRMWGGKGAPLRRRVVKGSGARVEREGSGRSCRSSFADFGVRMGADR